MPRILYNYILLSYIYVYIHTTDPLNLSMNLLYFPETIIIWDILVRNQIEIVQQTEIKDRIL